MLKKIFVVILLIGIIAVSGIKILDYQRIKSILIDILGDEKYHFVSKTDENIMSGIGGAEEIYIYNIEDQSQINCNSVDKNTEKTVFLSASVEKYISQSQPFCVKKYFKNGYSVKIIIQKNILILYIIS